MEILIMMIISMFAAVCVHELGHVLAGTVVGVKPTLVDIGSGPTVVSFKKGISFFRNKEEGLSIHLFPFSGASEFVNEDVEKLNPVCESFIYLAGPVLNLLIASGIYAYMTMSGTVLIGHSMLHWMLYCQASLGLVNLLPISSFDGGQVIVSILRRKNKQVNVKTVRLMSVLAAAIMTIGIIILAVR